MRRAGERGYGHFPLDRHLLARRTVGTLFTRPNICGVLTTRPRATAQDHNDLRNTFKADTVTPREAQRRGVKAVRIPIAKRCPANYGWANSPEYRDVKTCADVTAKFGTKGIPTAMYAVQLPADEAMGFLNQPSQAPLYTRYANSGPIPCGAGRGYRDSYHQIHACWICPDIKFVMRAFEGKGWSAWTLGRSCTTPESGTTNPPSNLIFDNGVRVFVPVGVGADGRREAWTIVVSQVAAASTSMFAFLVSEDRSFQRFVGGEVAKRLLLEARRQGWTIR